MLLQQRLLGAHLHHNSFLARRRICQPAAARGAFQRGHPHYTKSSLSLNFKVERGDLKWYGVGGWWNRTFRYKISSIRRMGENSRSVEQACLLGMLTGRQAGTDLSWRFLWALEAFKDNLAQSPPSADGETKAQRDRLLQHPISEQSTGLEQPDRPCNHTTFCFELKVPGFVTG